MSDSDAAFWLWWTETMGLSPDGEDVAMAAQAWHARDAEVKRYIALDELRPPGITTGQWCHMLLTTWEESGELVAKVEMLRQQNLAALANEGQLQEEVERLRAALAYYADGDNWSIYDEGWHDSRWGGCEDGWQVARDALAGGKEE